MYKYLGILLLFLGSPFFAKAAVDAMTVRYLSNYTIEKGRLTLEKKVVIQINNQEGLKYGTIYIPYTAKDKISKLEVQIEKPSGELIRKIKKSEIQDVSAISDFSLYEDDYVKKIPVRYNRFPFRISYSYQISYHRFFQITDWIPIIDTDVPTLNAELRISTPLHYPIKIYRQHIEKAKASADNETMTYLWKTSIPKIPDEEVFSPSVYSLLPRVEVVPKNFEYGSAGSFSSWQTYGKWQSQLLEEADDLPDSEKSKVKQMVSHLDSPIEKARKIYQYLQDNTRYINVTLGIGGLKPYPASYVSTNKYGDCKALTNYMKALLEAAGIQAYCCDIYAGGTHRPVLDSFPSQQFNHVVLMLPLNQDTTWIECTNNSIPFGYVGTSIQNRKAFLIDEQNSQLIHTPSLSPEQVQNRCVIDYNVHPNQKCEAHYHYTFRGNAFGLFNQLYTSYPANVQEDYIRDFLPERDFTLKSWKLSKANREASTITLDATLELNHFGKMYGEDLAISPIPLSIPRFEAPNERKLPVQMSYPICSQDSIVYHFTQPVKLDEIPDSVSIHNTFGSLEMQATATDKQLTLKRRFIINGGDIDLTSYPAFYQFIRNIKSKTNLTFLTTTKL
ncbi:DUF3857 domain-containing transglutaminase family protein [Prolixibacter denitrificans]|uniref:Transglutaminase-like putative cysteine protease n=1 Tax=Prolixibacter denitrificans TaxID=1541063 RepID=A0A2P8CKR0_9BACT|nr:DUF3857 domain-containing transglutaminase family protein [Prolixibacter denitrificans]PSK85542.1 transglutaminase-like putative cysteine protease [Prolixibacter denitrificans]GET20162.1 hypothetical protein JCM18694_04080 [Prolixibacter denitrificans]